MSKLTKQQSTLHAQACDLLQKEALSLDERLSAQGEPRM